MPLINLILQAQYEGTNFDPSNIYLAVSTVLLSVCVYFLKKHVDGQDKLNSSVQSLAIDIAEIKTNSGNTVQKVSEIYERVEEIENTLNSHDTEIKIIKSKIAS